MSLIPLSSVHRPPQTRYGVAGEFTLVIQQSSSFMQVVTIRVIGVVTVLVAWLLIAVAESPAQEPSLAETNS